MGVAVEKPLEEGGNRKPSFISKVRIFYPIPFTFILEVQELLYLYVASIHMGVKVEQEIRNV